MLDIIFPAVEHYDDDKNEFVTFREQTIRIEHSLVSLSKWESKWGKPFLSKEGKTIEEAIDYIRCMTITQSVNPDIYNYLTQDIVEKVDSYINAPMTATTFSKDLKQNINREPVTAEIIYYWMVSLNIPFECQKWHLNRLFTLINVCSIRNKPPKNMSKSEILSRNSAINASRRQLLNSKG